MSVAFRKPQSTIDRGRAVLERIGLVDPRDPDPTPPTREEMVGVLEDRQNDVETRTKVRRALAVKRAERESAIEKVKQEFAETIDPLVAKEAKLRSAGLRLREAEAALRETCHPAVAEDGPVLHWLRAFRRHLGTHTTREISRIRNNIRDMKRRAPADGSKVGNALNRITEIAEKHDRAIARIAEVEAAMDRVQGAQLEADPDVRALVSEIRDELGERCPVCGDLQRLAGGKGYLR